MIDSAHRWRRFAARRQEGAGSSALFLIGSVVSHGLLYGIAASVSSVGVVNEQSEPAWIEIAVTEAEREVVRAPKHNITAPAQEPIKVAALKEAKPRDAKPQKNQPLRKAKIRTLTRQEPLPGDAKPEHVAPSIDDAGIEESTEDSSVIVDSEATSAEPAHVLPSGLGDGTEQKVDPRVVIRAWMKKVQRSVQMRALRDYPRAAQRMRLQGNVFVAMNVDASGRVTNVRATRASGHSTLDDAAIEAVLAIGELPTPPAEFLRIGKPLTIPVAYRIR